MSIRIKVLLSLLGFLSKALGGTEGSFASEYARTIGSDSLECALSFILEYNVSCVYSVYCVCNDRNQT